MARRRMWVIGGTLIALTALVVAGVRSCAKGERAPKFETVSVTRGDLQVTVLATGTVQPQNRLELKPPIAGRTESILVEEGQPVKEGQVLAWMSSSERAALLDAARAKGPEELAHWEQLYKPTPLVAPIDGMVIARNVEPGQSVTATDAVLVLSDRLIVKTDVDETDIGQIRDGQRAWITLDAYPDQRIDGQVDHIAYEAKTVNNVTVYEVDVLPTQVPDVMRSGMTANVTFLIAAKHDVTLVPAAAVHQERGQSTVLVPTASKQPEHRPITTGLTDGKRVEVLSGLEAGDNVLVGSLRPSRGAHPTQGSPLTPMGRPPQRAGGGGSR